MAKTLKDFLEGYLKVKSADEQKFIDKHVTAKNPDRNGNGDDVFKGNTKTIDRRKERKGYNPGEDEKVYEGLSESTYEFDVSGEDGKAGVDKFVKHANSKGIKAKVHTYDGPAGGNSVVHLTHKDPKALHSYVNTHMYPVHDISKHKINEALKGNQHKIDANKNGKVDAHDFKLLRGKKKVAEEAEELDELSKATVGSYAQKAKDELSRTEYLAGKKMGERMHGAKVDNAERKLNTKASKRYKGLGMAINKLAKEEVEELDEKLTAKTPMGTYIKDFKKSDAPQFKGKSASKRRVMAIAAKLTAERGGKPLRKEERLQNRINDLSEVHQRTIMHVFEKLNEDNKSKFLEACDTPEGVEQMLDFAINHRGE
jgi:hypothetical protein